VNVTAKAFRRVALYEPGGRIPLWPTIDFVLTAVAEYTATLTYNNGSTTKATWQVRDLDEARKAKNIIIFIGDGMTTNMITVSSRP
jgi:alkaline phosphatase